MLQADGKLASTDTVLDLSCAARGVSAWRTVVVILVACAPFCARAWGTEAHELIAELAWQQLPAQTQQRIELLLAHEPGENFVSIASWADRVRSPTTARWHFVNFPRDAECSYDPKRDCPDGRCVVDAIERQSHRLATAHSLEERLIALKWVVHLVGDAHQPLHAGSAEDKGGNLIQLRAYGRGTNLHALWDSGLIMNWPGGTPALREQVKRSLSAASGGGNAARWVEESCAITRTPGFQPPERVVDDAYSERWRATVALRLAAAAKRLAGILEKVSD